MSSETSTSAVASLDPEPIHAFFGLSYSSYLVFPRSILQSAPVEWQREFVELLEELRDLSEGVEFEPAGGYRVQALDSRGRFIRDEFADYRRGRRRVPLREGRRHG